MAYTLPGKDSPESSDQAASGHRDKADLLINRAYKNNDRGDDSTYVMYISLLDAVQGFEETPR